MRRAARARLPEHLAIPPRSAHPPLYTENAVMRRTYLALTAPLLLLACDDASAPPAPDPAHATPPALMTIPILPKIAFASDRDGDNDIYTIAPDGSVLVKVTDTAHDDETQPAWDRRVR